jgi:hypothetical protein
VAKHCLTAVTCSAHHQCSFWWTLTQLPCWIVYQECNCFLARTPNFHTFLKESQHPYKVRQLNNWTDSGEKKYTHTHARMHTHAHTHTHTHTYSH